MTTEALADLLLVRLGREEEKQRVKTLLIQELQFSDGEAEELVGKSPTVIRQGVPIRDARIIQSKLYPYIDLLPRIEVREPDTDETESLSSEPEKEMEQEIDEDEGDYFADLETNLNESPTDQGSLPGWGDKAESRVSDPEIVAASYGFAPDDGTDEVSGEIEIDDSDKVFADFPDDETEDSDVGLISSASEELKTIERCHICGKTPFGEEKLAPCSNCGKLTCRDCFDRVAHVCNRCSEKGKVVDRPPQDKPDYLKEESEITEEYVEPVKSEVDREYSFYRPDSEDEKKEKRPKRQILVVITAVLLTLLAGAAFIVIDPLGMNLLQSAGLDNLFSGSPEPDSLIMTTLPDSSIQESDTLSVQPVGSDSLPEDSTEIIQETSSDSLDTVDIQDPLNLRNCRIEIPDSLIPEDIPSIDLMVRGVPSGLVVMRNDLNSISDQISIIAASIPIKIDRVTLVEDREGIIFLALSILHPEDDTQRYAFLRKLGEYLVPSGIDEIVVYYTEGQYYPVRVFSFMNEKFENMTQAYGPVDFQTCSGTHDERTFQILSGPMQEWLSAF